MSSSLSKTGPHLPKLLSNIKGILFETHGIVNFNTVLICVRTHPQRFRGLKSADCCGLLKSLTSAVRPPLVVVAAGCYCSPAHARNKAVPATLCPTFCSSLRSKLITCVVALLNPPKVASLCAAALSRSVIPVLRRRCRSGHGAAPVRFRRTVERRCF